MKQYTFSELKAVIESHIEYQLEHAFNRAEWVENQGEFVLTKNQFQYDANYVINIRYAVGKRTIGEVPNDEVVYEYHRQIFNVKSFEPINIIQVLNKVDTMLEEATKPYFN
jgi:hypothetical protein